MTLLVRCEKGHAYWQADVYLGDWPKGTPICPECAREWLTAYETKDESERVGLPPPPWSVEEGWLGLPKTDEPRCVALWLNLDVVMPHVGQRVLLRTVNSYDSVQHHIAALERSANGHSYFWHADKDAIVDRVIGWWPLPKREGGS